MSLLVWDIGEGEGLIQLTGVMVSGKSEGARGAQPPAPI